MAGPALATYPTCNKGTPSASDVEAAKGMHKAAEQYFSKKNYARAATSWKDAYSFDCTAHRLLINIGNAYELLGDLPNAVDAFETYIARTAKPDAEIVRRAEELRKKLKNGHGTLPQPPTPTPGPGPNPQPPTPTPTPTPGPIPQPGTGSEASAPIGAFVVMGLGGALAIGGTVTLAIGGSQYNDAISKCPLDPIANAQRCPTQALTDQGNDAKIIAPLGGIMLGVGVATVVGGVIWWAVGSDDSPSTSGSNSGPRVSVLPTANIGPGGASFGLNGSF